MREMQGVPVLWKALLLAALCAAGLASANSSATSPETTLQKARATGLVRIGYANEAPFAYLDVVSGRVTGEAPEIARVILTRLGIPHVESILTEFGSLIPGLRAGRFDIIAAGMYILPERCREIRFSNPSYSTGESFLVRRGNPEALHSYDDVRSHPAARLGVVAGAVEVHYAAATGIPSRQVLVFPDDPSAVEGLIAGRIDAFAATEPTARDLAKKAADQHVEVAQPFHDPDINRHPARGYGAFGFRPDDGDFVDAFNQELHTFIGSPAHEALVRPFGFTPRQLPGPVTAAALCAQPAGG